jgi:hypothetical protein
MCPLHHSVSVVSVGEETASLDGGQALVRHCPEGLKMRGCVSRALDLSSACKSKILGVVMSRPCMTATSLRVGIRRVEEMPLRM